MVRKPSHLHHQSLAALFTECTLAKAAQIFFPWLMDPKTLVCLLNLISWRR